MQNVMCWGLLKIYLKLLFIFYDLAFVRRRASYPSWLTLAGAIVSPRKPPSRWNSILVRVIDCRKNELTMIVAHFIVSENVFLARLFRASRWYARHVNIYRILALWWALDQIIKLKGIISRVNKRLSRKTTSGVRRNSMALLTGVELSKPTFFIPPQSATLKAFRLSQALST